MKNWIDRETALALLGIKAQTLYAYVSRGRIRMWPDPADARRSLYHAGDIDALVTQRSRGRRPAAIAASALALGEPAIATSVSTSTRGMLFYKGHSVPHLARTASLENVAALLWDAAGPVDFVSRPVQQGSAFTALANLAITAQPSLGRGSATLAEDAGMIVGTLASACGASPGKAALHRRLAEGWGCAGTAEAKIREALILMADHDMTASTFAVRVAASTGASLAACVLAGLCALSGPRHGGASAALGTLIEDAAREGCTAALDRWLNRGIELPGFGHPLYPDGDPRTAVLLEGVTLTDLMNDLARTVHEKTGLLPNCDFGLTGLASGLGLPVDAPFMLFLIGRSVGWCAHAMEQVRSGHLIRPRGRYEGVAPVFE